MRLHGKGQFPIFILFTQPSAVSLTSAKWIDSWARLQFRFFLNLLSCLLTTDLSRRNNRSRAGPQTLFNFRRNGNWQWIPLTFHVSSRYLAATRDVHSTATGCKWLAFCFTTMTQCSQSAHTAWEDTAATLHLEFCSLPRFHSSWETNMADCWTLH